MSPEGPQGNMKEARGKTNWRDYIESLEIWANDKGYFVNFSADGDTCVCVETKVIEINSSLPAKTQVYYLLHECGHILVANDRKFYTEPAINNFDRKTFTVLEEAEAWKRGYNLAKRLAIPINDSRWQREVFDAIGKYIIWASKEKNEND